MIGSVAITRGSLVARFVIGIGAFERAQADGREKFAFDDSYYGLLLGAVQEVVGEAGGEDLIGAQVRDRTFGGQDVVEAIALRVPKLCAEVFTDELRFGAIIGRIAPLSGER